MFKNNYHKRHFFLLIQMIVAPLMGLFALKMADGPEGTGTALSEGEEKLLSKIKKEIKEQGESQLKTLLDSVLTKFDEKIKDASNNQTSKEDYENFKNEIKESLDSQQIKKETLDEIHKKHAELLDVLEKQGVEIKRIKSTSGSMSDNEEKDFRTLNRKQQFEILLKKAIESQEFDEWRNKDFKAQTTKMGANKVIGLATDHTGPIFVTAPKDKVRDIPRMQPHMRDYLSVGMTDEPKVTFPEVTNYTDIYTLGTQMLAENDSITDVTFDSQEQTSNVARLGVSMSVSKRYFSGRSSVIINHVVSQLPDAMMFKEDVQILHGDGAGNNLNGIITDARAFDLTPNTYTAGAITAVASYNGGTQSLVTFANAHGLLNGDKITIANSTNYNATHEDILLIDETNIVINAAYNAESTAAWTGTGISYWYQKVDGAQEFDVLSAAASILDAGLYNADAIFVNPQTTRRIGTLKGSDLHYIGVSRDAAGRLNMDGIPIISIPTIPAGWFLIGDFSAKNVEILDYSEMTIQFLEDITSKRTNSVVILADMEIHLVKYNPNWYIYDRFSTSITQLETP